MLLFGISYCYPESHCRDSFSGFWGMFKGGELQMREVGHNFIAVNTVEDVNNGLYL